MKLIRVLDDIATDLEQQTRAIRDAATAASEVEDSADEQVSRIHTRLMGIIVMAKMFAKRLEETKHG